MQDESVEWSRSTEDSRQTNTVMSLNLLEQQLLEFYRCMSVDDQRGLLRLAEAFANRCN